MSTFQEQYDAALLAHAETMVASGPSAIMRCVAQKASVPFLIHFAMAVDRVR